MTRIIGFYYFIEKIIICGLAVHTYSVCILIYFPSLSKKKKALYCMQQLAPFIINSFMYSLLPHKLAIWITCWGAIHKWCHPLLWFFSNLVKNSGNFKNISVIHYPFWYISCLGKYTCIVSNTEGILKHTYHLDVLDYIRDVPILVSKSANLTLLPGMTANFQCKFETGIFKKLIQS